MSDLEPAAAHELSKLVEYAPSATVSRTIAKQSGGTMTVFAFDAKESLSEHSAPFDAWVLILDGRGIVVVDGRESEVGPGEIVLMPANVPHAIRAEERFKILLVMLKAG